MKYAEVAKLKHDPGCPFSRGDDYCDCGAIEKQLESRVARLESALERTLTNFQAVLARRPVRDAAETIAEATAALGR